MPFKSEAQRQACWARYNKAKRVGKKPDWDCKEWERETPKGKLPKRIRAKMAGNAVYAAKQDLQSYSDTQLALLAGMYKLPEMNRNDLCWTIAVLNIARK